MDPFESNRNTARRNALVFLWGLVLVMAGLTASEWYFRFARYHWEMQLFHLPSRPLAKMAGGHGFTTNVVPAICGGDLTALIGIHHAAEPFQEWRPPGVRILDAQGFVNGVYDPAATPDAVVVGDSFMTVGLLEDTFAARLARQSGRFVCNRALLGHGPFISVERYLDDPGAKDKTPAFLVWGFAEREISGKSFEQLFYGMDGRVRLSRPVHEQIVLDRKFGVHWESFAPSKLKRSLPSSSLLAQSAQWVWNRVRYLLFGQIHPDLIPSAGEVLDGPMLFYRYHIESLGLSAEDRNVPMVVKAIKKLDELCRIRGMRLIVLLIPEREEVYRRWLPERFNPPDHPLPPSSLGAIEGALQQQGVLVANMLPIFNEATARGQRVYWRDDTHWNPAGVELAAEKVWALMQADRR